MKRILPFLLVLILPSCNLISRSIAKCTGDFQDPQKETPESIIAYCTENKLNYNQLYIVKSEESFTSFFSAFRSIPGIFVFDKNRNLITTAVKTKCPWTMVNFVYDTSIQHKQIADTSAFHELLSNFKLINDLPQQNSPDYYILCAWAKFTPKLTKSLFETINKQKQENKLNVCHILLNVDLQQSWDKK